MSAKFIPFDKRRKASQELAEIAQNLMRGAASLMSKSAMLLHDDARKHHQARAQLARYQTHGMPSGDDVARIRAALDNLDEIETQDFMGQRHAKMVRDKAIQERQAKRGSLYIHPGTDAWRKTLDCGSELASLLAQAVHKSRSHTEQDGYLTSRLLDAIDDCVHSTAPNGDPISQLRKALAYYDRKQDRGAPRSGRVIPGPWADVS